MPGKKEYSAGNADPFNIDGDVPELPTLEAVDRELYGKIDAPESGRQVAKPIALEDIQPDLTQPRRAIPPAVRGQWEGDPEDIPGVLGQWHILAKQYSPFDIDVVKLLGGLIDLAPNTDERNPIVDEYLALIGLAASIHRDGLANPITVSAQGGSYVVETGERRLLAHWLLWNYVDAGKYGRIPARVVDQADVWRQAAENGARRPLNAIGMSRQLALLIMDMYRGDPGVKFDRYRDLVLPGECDRRFYAQVSNGNQYPVKRGMGQRVLDVTGLKSMEQVRQYRGLLGIRDDIWMQADVENWAEFRIRSVVDAIKPEPVTPADNTVTAVTVQPNAVTQPQHEPAQKPISVNRPITKGDRVMMKAAMQEWQARVVWTVDGIAGNNLATLMYIDEKEQIKKAYQYTHLLRLVEPEPEAAPPPAAKEPLPVLTFDELPGLVMDDTEVWHNGVRFRQGEDVNHIAGRKAVTVTFRRVDDAVYVVLEVITDQGSYISCCPITELTKPAPVMGTPPLTPPQIQGGETTASLQLSRPAPAKPEYTAPNDNRAMADEMRLASMLAKLQGLAELTGDHGMRDTCNYLRTVTPAQIKREVKQTSLAEYQEKVSAAMFQSSEYLYGIARQINALLEKMLDAAQGK